MDPQDISGHAFYPMTLPLTVAGIDFGGDHTGSERGAAPAAEFIGDRGRSDWFAIIAVSVSVLRIRRPAGEVAWRNGNERDHAAVIILACVHRRANFLEWRERIVRVVGEVKDTITPMRHWPSSDPCSAGRSPRSPAAFSFREAKFC